MSISFSLHIKGKKVNEELLINEINKLGVFKDINAEDDGNVLRIDYTYELLGFTVTFVKDEQPPYNALDTIFLKSDFEYNQSILFGFNKEGDFDISYNKALELTFNLMRQLDTSALLTSCVHNDICYFENSTSVYIRNSISLAEKIRNIIDTTNQWNCTYI